MSTLNIVLEVGRDLESHLGISTRLTRVAGVDGVKADRTVETDVAVSSGRGISNSFEVEPGEYLVETLLPSGDKVVDRCVVPVAGTATLLLGHGNPSLRLFEGVDAPHTRPSSVLGSVRNFAYPSAGGMLLDDAEGNFDLRFARPRPRSRAMVRTGRSLARPKRTPTPFEIMDYSLSSTASNVSMAQVSGLPRRSTFAATYARGIEPGRSTWVSSKREGFLDQAAIPVPWATPFPGQDADGSVLVSFADDAPPRVTVVDRAVGAMLAYLASARIDQANQALKHLEQIGFLPDNVDAVAATGHPFPYLAACYVSVLGRARSEHWTRRIDMLHRLFPASVDALVLLGRVSLENAQTLEDLNVSCSLFVTASRMEPPVFMVGVQMLLDGLAVFADENEEAAAGRRAFLPTAAAVDTTQPFTVLSFRQA